jgi:hypothetical protein
VLVRNNAPVFGANANVYMQPGEWQVSVSSRNLVSNDHYNGTVEQVQRQTLRSYVTNKQNLLDVTVTHVFNERFSASVGVPYVNSVWASRDPSSPEPLPRKEIGQNGRGLGDVTATARYWVFDPQTHLNWNVATGGGIKLPTGNSEAQDRFPNRVDPTNALRPVDQSVQPGDGGWGLIGDVQGFWRVNRVLLFGSGTYLANPKDTNDTPSIIPVLGLPLTGNFEGLGVNSVPDQYVARVGGSVAVWKGFSASLAWRIEGLKRYDLFGSSHGWRRPGTEMFWEPGISYSNGNHSFTFNIPIGYYYNRHRNPYTGREGDATFPRHVFLTSYTLKLGKLFARPPLITAPAPQQQEPAAPAQSPKKNGGETASEYQIVCPPVAPLAML